MQLPLAAISFQCASQPGALPMAKRTVNIFVGNPIACKMYHCKSPH